MIRYLLRELPEDERQDLSDRLLEDSSLYSQLLLVEDDLIGAYVRDELSPRQRERFQQYLMATPEQRERVEFSRTLVDYLGQNPELADSIADESAPQPLSSFFRLFQHPVVTLAIAGLLLLSTLAGIWFVRDAWRLRASLQRLRVEWEALKSTERQLRQELSEQRTLNAQLESQKTPGPAALVVSLIPGLVRDLNGPAKLVIPAATQLLQLRLSLDRADHSVAYRVIVKTTDGMEVLSQRVANSSQPPSRQVVLVDLPARLLEPADYLVTLQGTRDGKTFLDIADYYLRIREK